MSFIASMVAAAGTISAAAGGGILGGLAVGATGALGGAGLGAAASAIDGGDPLEGAQLGAGIGSAVFGGLGALGSAGVIGGAGGAAGGAASTGGAGLAGVGNTSLTAGSTSGILPTASQGGLGGLNSALTNIPGVTQATAQSATNAVNAAAPAADVVKSGASLANATNDVVNASQAPASVSTVPSGTLSPSDAGILPAQPGQPGFVGPQATQGQIANAKAYTDANMGTRFLADLTGQQGNIVGNTGLKMAGGALQSGVMNAGINGLVAGAQGQDVGEAMGKGALTGAVGGAASEGLASMAGPGGSLSEGVGNFAAKHDVLVPAALSMGSGMALDSALTSNPTAPEQKGIRSLYKWNPSVYKPYGPQFAAGGVTDLDNYDQTPQMQSPGTLDIPNRNEVANNQGYMGDSVQMMAKGGLSYGGGGILGSLPGANLMQSVYNTTLGDVISPDLRDFLFGTPDSQLSPEQRRKKAQLMQQEGASKGMAHGGISDLGGYSDGGRLLKGPGDGVSDDIPASIGGKQPARLAEGEFVVPARIVSELGNGSTDAGAKRLYQMMDRIQSDRKKTTGKGKFSDNPKAYKHLPA